MSRGPRKTIDEKINEKQAIINSLKTRIESEKRELEEMLQEKKLKDLEAVNDLIQKSGLSPKEAMEAIKQYVHKNDEL